MYTAASAVASLGGTSHLHGVFGQCHGHGRRGQFCLVGLVGWGTLWSGIFPLIEQRFPKFSTRSHWATHPFNAPAFQLRLPWIMVSCEYAKADTSRHKQQRSSDGGSVPNLSTWPKTCKEHLTQSARLHFGLRRSHLPKTVRSLSYAISDGIPRSAVRRCWLHPHATLLMTTHPSS